MQTRQIQVSVPRCQTKVPPDREFSASSESYYERCKLSLSFPRDRKIQD